MSLFHVKESSGGDAPYYDSDGNEYWEVERIVNKKVDPIDGILKYEVKWLGYPEEDNTWEPLESLEHVRKMVDDFEKARIASKNLPNKTPQHGKEISKRKDVKDGQLKVAQSKRMGENVLEQKQNKKQTAVEKEKLLAPKVTESSKGFVGNERGNRTNLDRSTPKHSSYDTLPNINTESLESKSISQLPGVISKDKEIIKNVDSTTAKNINLNPQQRQYARGLGDNVMTLVNHNEQSKGSSGLPQPANQSRYNPNYSSLNSHDKIVPKEEQRGSEFDIVSKTTGVSDNSRQREDEDKRAPLKNSSALGELFHPKKAVSKELDAMVIEDDDNNQEFKANANAKENIKISNSNPGEGPMITIKSPLNAESQPVKKKSRFQDASEVLGKDIEKLLDVPKAITRRESDKPTEKEKDMNIEANNLRRAVSSNAGIPSSFPQVVGESIENIEEVGAYFNPEIPFQPPQGVKKDQEELEMPLSVDVDIPSYRNSRFQEATEEKRKESDKSREKEESRERERDQSEDRRSNRQEKHSKKKMKKKLYSESQPPQVEGELYHSPYYEAIKEGYLKHAMNKNEFLEFLCPYGNFKDDKVERISKVFWEGKASANPDDYCFEIIWRVRSNGVHKAPSVVSWEDLLDGNPREAAKFSFGRLTKIFSHFGTLEEE